MSVLVCSPNYDNLTELQTAVTHLGKGVQLAKKQEFAQQFLGKSLYQVKIWPLFLFRCWIGLILSDCMYFPFSNFFYIFLLILKDIRRRGIICHFVYFLLYIFWHQTRSSLELNLNVRIVICLLFYIG